MQYKLHTNITIHVFCICVLLGKCSVSLAYDRVMMMMSTIGGGGELAKL